MLSELKQKVPHEELVDKIVNFEEERQRNYNEVIDLFDMLPKLLRATDMALMEIQEKIMVLEENQKLTPTPETPQRPLTSLNTG